jgi:hypothetical protein
MKLMAGQDNSVPTLYVESTVYRHFNVVWLLYSESCIYYFIVLDNPFVQTAKFSSKLVLL